MLDLSCFTNTLENLDFAIKLLEQNKINEHFINLLGDKQVHYSLIYSLRLVKLKILKTYIKTNLTNSFIRFFKLYHHSNTICSKKNL